MISSRLPPVDRDVVLNPADRVIAEVIWTEIQKHLGGSFIELRKRDEIIEEILPTLVEIHKFYKWRAEFVRWWLTTVGKAVALIFTSAIGLALLLGAVPALRVLVARWAAP
jgi:hypothetical protein